MIGFFNRLEQYFKSHGLTPGKVEKECGLGNATIANAMKRGSMTTEVLFKIVNHYKINLGWLYSGKGEMDGELSVDPKAITEKEELEIINVIDLNIERFSENEKFKRIIKEVKSSEFEEDIKKQISEMQKQIKSIADKTF